MNAKAMLPGIRKEEFTKARESLGLSTKVLSGMACLSVRQIEQIENGETNSFYSPQVKVTAAKKVATLLKLEEKDAFDFGEVVTPTTTSNENQDPPSDASASISENKLNPEKLVETKPVEKKIASNVDYRSKPNSQLSVKKKFIILLGVAAALVFSVVNLRPLFFPDAPKEEIIVVQEVVPEAPSGSASTSPDATTDSKADTNAPAASTASQSSTVNAVAVVTPNATTSSAPVSTDCPAVDSSTITYKPDAPKKAGDMVYLQPKSAQTVCVIDASGKTQTKTLESGVGASVYGKPPFKVLTGGLNQVDLYYQGSKVRLSNLNSKTIILEPAEVIQPLAPTESQ